jgi:hypothetical protein
MTTDERLARLTERHEALAQTVEILASGLGDKPKKKQKPEDDDDEPKVINVKWLGEL